MRSAKTYTDENIEAARAKLQGLLATAALRRLTTADTIKQLNGEISALLKIGLTFEEVATQLNTGDPMGIIEITAPTLKRYYYKSKTRAPKVKASSQGVPRSAKPRESTVTHPVATRRQSATQSSTFTEMPEVGSL